MEQSESKTTNSLSDFAVLPLHYPPSPSFPLKTTHHLYVRPHAPRIPSPDDDRALFLSNIPADTTESHLKHLFASRLGNVRVARIDFDEARASKAKKTEQTAANAGAAPRGKKRKRAAGAADPDGDAELRTGLPATWEREVHTSGSSAVVVLVDRASRDAAWKAVRRAAKGGNKTPAITWGEGVEGVPPLGSQRYRAHDEASFPDADTLQTAVDSYMAAFAERESAHSRKLARQRAEPDADGFVTVVRGGRAGPARVEEAQAVLQKQQERERAKADSRGSFYRFQVRERRKESQKELVRRFDEDRRVVEGMRVEKEGVFVPT